MGPARAFSLRTLITKKVADAPELLRIEMGSGRNIESASGACRGRHRDQEGNRDKRPQYITRIHGPSRQLNPADLSARLNRHKACRPRPAPAHGGLRCRLKSSRKSRG